MTGRFFQNRVGTSLISRSGLIFLATQQGISVITVVENKLTLLHEYPQEVEVIHLHLHADDLYALFADGSLRGFRIGQAGELSPLTVQFRKMSSIPFLLNSSFSRILCIAENRNLGVLTMNERPGNELPLQNLELPEQAPVEYDLGWHALSVTTAFLDDKLYVSCPGSYTATDEYRRPGLAPLLKTHYPASLQTPDETSRIVSLNLTELEPGRKLAPKDPVPWEDLLSQPHPGYLLDMKKNSGHLYGWSLTVQKFSEPGFRGNVIERLRGFPYLYRDGKVVKLSARSKAYSEEYPADIQTLSADMLLSGKKGFFAFNAYLFILADITCEVADYTKLAFSDAILSLGEYADKLLVLTARELVLMDVANPQA